MRKNKIVSVSAPSGTNIINEYFQWLCDIINVNTFDRSYWLLAKTLYKKEFIWTVPNDDNRDKDGKKLRDRFADEMNYESYDVIEGPCMMLEMLIALAERIEDMMIDTTSNNRTDRWFWEILDNCGLTTYTDENYADSQGILMIDYILNNVLERNYKRNGKGGLFPLKNAKKDQRKVEIWYQMCGYLLENYYIEDEKL